MNAVNSQSNRALTFISVCSLSSSFSKQSTSACQEACPKEISIDVIKRMNRDYLVASAKRQAPRATVGSG